MRAVSFVEKILRLLFNKDIFQMITVKKLLKYSVFVSLLPTQTHVFKVFQPQNLASVKQFTSIEMLSVLQENLGTPSSID